MPDGCHDSPWRRMRDEWGSVWRIWRVRESDRTIELGLVSAHANRVAAHVLRTKRSVRDFLDS